MRKLKEAKNEPGSHRCQGEPPGAWKLRKLADEDKGKKKDRKAAAKAWTPT
ncbi:MAG: hypothetical protein AB1468_01005 [Candidatus Micrarchaeota archaeon]